MNSISNDVLSGDSPPKVGDRPLQAFVTLLILIVIGLLGVIGYSISNTVRQGATSTLSIGLLVAAASLAVGGFFGFLFGMPRSADRASSTHKTTDAQGKVTETLDPDPPRTKPNTNLEEISDWLTKILVGAGLTQLNKIQTKLGDLSSYVAAGMGGNPADKSFVSVTVVFFGVCGFLAAFLWARLYMAKALQQADGLDEVKQALKETSDRLKETDQRQQGEIEKAKGLVKKLALTGAEQAMEDPLLSETGQLKAEKSQIELAANFVENEDQASLDSKDLLILAYNSLEKEDYKGASQFAQQAISATPPPQALWKIYNLMGLCYHWQQPPNWKPGDETQWFENSIKSYERAIANKNTLAEELLSKANSAFVYLDAQRYSDCEQRTAEVIGNEGKGGTVILQICDLAKIADAASKVLHGDMTGAEKSLNQTRNISSFEYLFNPEDLPAEAIKRFAGLAGLREEIKAFILKVAQALKLIP
jgi:hypothetical protein